MFHYMDILHFVHLVIDIFFFPVWDYLSKVAMNICVQIFVWAYVFVLLGTKK